MIEQAIYSLRTPDDTMAPRYEPGEQVLVHQASPARPGDHVVVLCHPERGGPVAPMIRRLVTQEANALTVERYTPRCTETIPTHRVRAVHRVVSFQEATTILAGKESAA